MNNLQDGIDALKAGKRDDAQKLFVAAIKENPKDERAWQWMYNAASDDKQRLYCLQQVLHINPKNEKAAQLFEKLNGPIDHFATAPSSAIQAPTIEPPVNQKKKSNTTFIALAVTIVCVAIICCVASLSNAWKELEVKYVIKGSAPAALVTYFNAQGGTEQITQSLPFEKVISVKPGAVLSLVAQNQGSGTIICEIWVNGVQKKTSTSTTEYGVVTCTDFASP